MAINYVELAPPHYLLELINGVELTCRYSIWYGCEKEHHIRSKPLIRVLRYSTQRVCSVFVYLIKLQRAKRCTLIKGFDLTWCPPHILVGCCHSYSYRMTINFVPLWKRLKPVSIKVRFVVVGTAFFFLLFFLKGLFFGLASSPTRLPTERWDVWKPLFGQSPVSCSKPLGL